MGKFESIAKALGLAAEHFGGDAAAVPTQGLDNPAKLAKQGYDWYNENVAEPLKNKFIDAQANTFKQDPAAMKQDPIMSTASGIVTDPTSLVGFAEGGEVGDFDSMVADASPQGGGASASPNDFDSMVSDEDKYGTGEQQVKAGLEGFARGVAGPIAPFVEKRLGVKPEAQLGRERENPITAGVGEAVGLVGGALTGVGEGALLEGAGRAATEAAGLAKPVSYLGRVGSSAVQQAAEMAVLQSGNEASKMILHDPDTSAESAIANIGLSSALGGLTGGFITGAVSPLWHATVGDKLTTALGDLRTHLNGGEGKVPEDLKAAANTLGVELPDTVAGAHTSERLRDMYGTIKRAENPEILRNERAFTDNISKAVADSLGTAPEDVLSHSENQAGHDLLDTFKKEYKDKYGDFEAAYKARNEEANKISIPDDARLSHYDTLIEKGIAKTGTDSEHFPLYDKWGQRLLAKDNVGGIDQLVSELGNDIGKANRAGDNNLRNVLSDIRNSFKDFQETQITFQAAKLEAEGVEYGKALGSDLLKEREALNSRYRDFAQMSDDLQNHLGVGDFKGRGALEGKLTDDITPEQLLKKFSIKNNADFIPFLETHFPETLQQVKSNELKSFLKPAVLGAKGDQAINTGKLVDLINKSNAGKPEYVKALFSQDALDKIAASETLKNAIPTPKDSGTPAGLMKNLIHMPASAMAMVAGFIGHNPVIGGIAGHLSTVIGKDMPEAIKLGMLKFAGSEQPIKAEGFKAMVDFMHNTIKGENAINQSVKAVLKSGAQVLTDKTMPFKADRDKLDKIVTKYQDKPDELLQIANGNTGHYLPQHQTALTSTAVRQVQYLQGLKPHPFRSSPLDREVEPSPTQMYRYNRALDIANNPSVVLHHVKEGTLQASDIQDLNAMYPGLYKRMSTQMSQEMTNKHHDGAAIPYKTRMGMSLFLGQALDSSMTPANIMAAQPQATSGPMQESSQHGKKTTGSLSKLGKTTKSYMTPGQAAESDRSNRD